MSNPLAISCLIPFLAARSALSNLSDRILPDPDAGGSLSLPRVRAEEVDLAGLLEQRSPVILEGLTGLLAPRRSADLATLQQAGKSMNSRFEVKVYDGDAPYFLYTGNYGQKVDRIEEMDLSSFLIALFEDDQFRGKAVYRQFDQRSLEGVAGALLSDIADALSVYVKREPEKRASGIWIGSRGVVTPLHYDAWPGLLFQTHGSKRVLMFSPTDIQRLYFLPQYAVGDRWSRLPARSSEANAHDFPRYGRTQRLEGHLHQGEALFIPPFWPHEIEALEPNISVPFRFSTATSDYLNPRFLRPACEVFYNRYLKHRR